ncbi:hypothetical protein J8273_1358 [Carpediemonas membranifera]|uniref:PH domain-containing protein n=1 Tax=Carpediemonas membranifera TaxID=201153 RepID=A0A8J6BBU6_9EUKA|nr:hypothetical protein J8273_1358 [Carpediemonas membranifera]|eukprot:KAG9397007.1 hypothetical protein J8273_1358 [Carpediemonas membranifera]
MSARGTRATQRQRSLLRHSFVSENRPTFTSRSTLITNMQQEEDKNFKAFGNISFTINPTAFNETIEGFTLGRTKLANQIERLIFSVSGLGEMHVLAAEQIHLESLGNQPVSDSDPAEKASDAWFVTPKETTFALNEDMALCVARDWAGAYAVFFVDHRTKQRGNAILAGLPISDRVTLVRDDVVDPSKDVRRLTLAVDDTELTFTTNAASRNSLCKALSVAVRAMYPASDTVGAKLLMRMLSVDFALSRIDDDDELVQLPVEALPSSKLQGLVEKMKSLPSATMEAKARRRALLEIRKMVRNNETRNLLITALAGELEAICSAPNIAQQFTTLNNLLPAIEQMIVYPWKHGAAFNGTLARVLVGDDEPDLVSLKTRLETRLEKQNLQQGNRTACEGLLARTVQLQREMTALDALSANYPKEGRTSLAPVSFPADFHVDELIESMRGVVKTAWQPGLYVAALVIDEADQTVLIESSGNLPSVLVSDPISSPMKMEEFSPEDAMWLRSSAARDAKIIATDKRTVSNSTDLRGKVLSGLVELSKTLNLQELGLPYDRLVVLSNPRRGKSDASTPPPDGEADSSYQNDKADPDRSIRVVLHVRLVNSGVKPDDKKNKRRQAKEATGYKIRGASWVSCNDAELALYHSYAGVSKNVNMESLPKGFDGIRFIRAAEDYYRLRQPQADVPAGVHLTRVHLLPDITGDYVLVDTVSRQLPVYSLDGCVGTSYVPMDADLWGWVQSIAVHRAREGPTSSLRVDPEVDKEKVFIVERLREAYMSALEDMIADWGDEGVLYDSTPILLDEDQRIQLIPYITVWESAELPPAIRPDYVWRPIESIETDYATRHQGLRLSQYRADVVRAEESLREARALARTTGNGNAVRLAQGALEAKQTVWQPMRWLTPVQAWAALGMKSVLEPFSKQLADPAFPISELLAQANQRYLMDVGGITNDFVFRVVTSRVSSDDLQMALKKHYSDVVEPVLRLLNTSDGEDGGDGIGLTIPAKGVAHNAESWQLVDSIVRNLLGISGDDVDAPNPVMRPAEQVEMGTPPLEMLDVEFSLKDLLTKVDFKLTTYDICRCLVEELVETSLVQTVDTPIFLEVENTLDDIVEVVVTTTELVEDAVWDAIHSMTRRTLEQEKGLLNDKISSLFTQPLSDVDIPDDPSVPVAVDVDVRLPAKPMPLQYADLVTPFTPAIRQMADRHAQLVRMARDVLAVADSGRELAPIVDTVTEMTEAAETRYATALEKAERAKRAHLVQQRKLLRHETPTAVKPSPKPRTSLIPPPTASVSIAELISNSPVSKPATPTRSTTASPSHRERPTRLRGSAKTEHFIRGLKNLNSVYHQSMGI